LFLHQISAKLLRVCFLIKKAEMRKYFLAAVAIASSVIISCQQTPSAPPPEVTAVVNQLMAIDASTKVGVNQIEYSKSLTELQLAIDKYKDSDFAKKNPSLTTEFDRVLFDQKVTLAAWQECTADDRYGVLRGKGYCWEKNTASFLIIFSRYPDIQNDESIREKDSNNEGYFYSGKQIVQKMWEKNSSSLAAIKQKLKSQSY
jgi:hypothetical protein